MEILLADQTPRLIANASSLRTQEACIYNHAESKFPVTPVIDPIGNGSDPVAMYPYIGFPDISISWCRYDTCETAKFGYFPFDVNR
jgi:hypothetical protein